MLLYNEVSSAYFKLILKNPPDPDPLLRQGTLFIPGTIFSILKSKVTKEIL